MLGSCHFFSYKFIALLTAISSLVFGYQITVLNYSSKVFLKCNNESRKDWDCYPINSSFLWSLIVGFLCIGGILGSVFASLSSGKLGRTSLVLIGSFHSLVGTLLTALSFNAVSLSIGRVLLGIAAGIASVVTPVFLSEISPFELRGTIAFLHQFGIVCGLVLAEVCGLFLLKDSDSNNHSSPLWRVQFGILLPLILIQLVFFLYLKFKAGFDSPKWLIYQNLREKAKLSMDLLHLPNESTELNEMVQEYTETQRRQSKASSFLEMLRSAPFRKNLFVALFCHVAQIFSG